MKGKTKRLGDMGLDFYLNELSFIALILKHTQPNPINDSQTFRNAVRRVCVCVNEMWNIFFSYAENGQWIVKWTLIISFNFLPTYAVRTLLIEQHSLESMVR